MSLHHCPRNAGIEKVPSIRNVTERKLRLVFSVAIVSVLVALSVTIFRTALFITMHHGTVFRVVENYRSKELASYMDIWTYSSKRDMQEANSTHSKDQDINPKTAGEQHDFAGNKMILVLDFWERMINVQSGLRRLVQLGVESGFSVVEPLVYESKVSRKYSFPEHFVQKNMTPQTATLYFKTDDLYITNRYISQAQFRRKILIHTAKQKNTKNGNDIPPVEKEGKLPQYLIQAIVFINWNTQNSTDGTLSKQNSRPFDWCDSKLKRERLPVTSYGHLLGPNFHVQRALCLNSGATVAPARFGPRLFHEMFAFVKNGTVRFPQMCERCVTLAFMNYRKHAFTGFVSHTGSMPFRQKTPPLEVGAVPQALAEKIQKELLRDRPYLAIQLRTGKAFVLLDRYERNLLAKGLVVTRHGSFKSWLESCTMQLVSEARRVSRKLGPRAVFYIASDMYNDGWKGGETCPQTVKEALNKAKAFLDTELKQVKWFNPYEFGIKQDSMGISGLADAAMCLKSDRFMYAVPSNFAEGLKEILAERGKPSRWTSVIPAHGTVKTKTAMLLHLTPADHTLLDFKVMSALAPQAILRMFCAMVNDIKPTYLAEIFV